MGVTVNPGVQDKDPDSVSQGIGVGGAGVSDPSIFPTSLWILSTTDWVDSSIWIDTELWMD